MAAIRGVPNPPFRIIEPNGAPIINNIKQAMESTILRCHSILCRRSDFSLSFIVTSLLTVAEPEN